MFANKKSLLDECNLRFGEMPQEVIFDLVFIQTGVFSQHNHSLAHSFQCLDTTVLGGGAVSFGIVSNYN